jgi:hypothetical protein
MGKKEIEKVLQDIHYIKEIISKDSVALEKFLVSAGIRYLSLFFGMGVALVSLLAYFSLKMLAGNLLLLKWSIASGLIIFSIIGGFVKWMTWNKLFPDMPWPNMLFKVVGIPVLKIVFLLVSLILGFTIGLTIGGLYQYILLVWAIGIGMAYCIYGSLFNIFVLEITGYFILISGCASLLFIYDRPVEAWLWSAIVFGGGFIIYFVISTLSFLSGKGK